MSRPLVARESGFCGVQSSEEADPFGAVTVDAVLAILAIGSPIAVAKNVKLLGTNCSRVSRFVHSQRNDHVRCHAHLTPLGVGTLAMARLTASARSNALMARPTLS